MRNVPFLSLFPSSSSWVGSRRRHSTCSSWTSGCRFPPWGCVVVIRRIFYCIYDIWISVNKILDLGFLMMLPHEAALITSGITKILEIYRSKMVVLYKMVYELRYGLYVGVPVYLHHVLVCLSRICHQGVYSSLLVIREECRDWSGCGGAIVQVCVQVPRL